MKVVLYTCLTRVLSAIVNLLVLSATAHILGAEGRGLLATILTAVGVCSTISYLSLGQVLLQRVASLGFSENLLRSVFNILMTNTVLLTLVFWSLSLLLYFYSDNTNGYQEQQYLMLIGIVFLPAIMWDQYSKAFLSIQGRIIELNLLIIFGKGTTVATLALLMFFKALTVTSAIALSFVGSLVTNTALILRLVRQHGIQLPNWTCYFSFVKDGLLLHVGTLATYIFSATDILMLSSISGVKETGIYQFGVSVVYMVLLLPQAAVLYINSIIAESSFVDAWAEQRKIIVVVVVICSLAGLGLYGYSDLWIAVIGGGGFNAVERLLHLQSLTMICMSLGILLAPQWIARGLFKTVSSIAVVSAVSNLVLNYLLIPIYQAKGAALASLLSYLIVLIASVYMIIKCEMDCQSSSMVR